MGCCEQGQLGRVARYFTDRKGQRHANTSSEFAKLFLFLQSVGKYLHIQVTFVDTMWFDG